MLPVIGMTSLEPLVVPATYDEDFESLLKKLILKVTGFSI